MNTYRKLTTLAAALFMLTASAASAEIYHSTPERIREVPDYGPGPGYGHVEVEIWTDRGDGARYCAGEAIEVFFRTNVDAWVAIYDLDTRGRITKLFPRRHSRENFVRGGVINRLPASYGHHMEVEGPSGWETLRAVASTHRRALRDFDRRGGGRHDGRYDGRSDGRYDDRYRDHDRYEDRSGRYSPTSTPVTRVPAPVTERLREVPNHPPRDYPEVVVAETRHYVRDGYRCRVPRPWQNRPWWHRR